jgi:hypothetical protein
LNGPWKEAQERVVTLKDVDCNTCKNPPSSEPNGSANITPANVFVDWMYMHRLPTESEDRYDIHDSADTLGPSSLAQLKVLIFADRILASLFKRSVHNRLLDDAIDAETPCYELIIYAFANLPADSPILTLLVELHYRHFELDDDTVENGELQLRQKLPHEFLLRVVLRFARDRKERYVNDELIPCEYHVHATDKEEKKCEKARADEEKAEDVGEWYED